MDNSIVGQGFDDSTDPRLKAVSASQSSPVPTAPSLTPYPTPPPPSSPSWTVEEGSQPQGWDPYQSSPSGAYTPYSYTPPSQPYTTNTWNSSERPENTVTVLNNARNADPSDIRAVGVSQLELINRYHRNVLQQAQQSFLWAIVAAGIGLGFYVAAVSFLLLKQPVNISDASLISGTLVEVIAGINFFLYGKASSQLASFHVYLDRTHRFLLANSACENIMADTQKDTTRAEIIQTIMMVELIVKPSSRMASSKGDTK